MSDILRDPMWQFIGAMLALIAIFLSVYLYRKQRRRKSLTYNVISCTPLLSMREEIGRELQIIYNKKPVDQAHLILIKLINSGDLPIPSADYEVPISLGFGEEAQLLTAEVVKTEPVSLQASMLLKGNRLEITPCLLNPTDSITIKALIAKFGNSVVVRGRIVGVKEIKKFTKGFNLFPILGGVGLAVMMSTFVLDAMYRPEGHPLSRYLLYGGVCIMIISLILDMLRSKRAKTF